MRFMILLHSDATTEKGCLPDEKMLTEMGNYNEALVKAGIMLDGNGLQPTSKGALVKWNEGGTAVTDGPFAESKEVIAGYWLWKCESREEALEWIRRAPFGPGAVVEVRQVFEAEDFGAEYTPELRAQEDRLRAEIAASTR